MSETNTFLVGILQTRSDRLTARRGFARAEIDPETMLSSARLRELETQKFWKSARSIVIVTASGPFGITGFRGSPVSLPSTVRVADNATRPETVYSVPLQSFDDRGARVRSTMQLSVFQVTLPLASLVRSIVGRPITAGLANPHSSFVLMSSTIATTFLTVRRLTPWAT